MKRIVPFLVGVIAINVLLRVVPLPEVSLPSLPDLPGWVHTVLRVKNAVLIGIVMAVIVTAVVEDHRKRAR